VIVPDKCFLYKNNLENIFDQIRNHNLKVTPELINIIFDSIDFIKKLKEAIVNGNLEEINISPYVEKLNTFQGSDSIETNMNIQVEEVLQKDSLQMTLDDYQKTVVQQGINLGHNALEVNIKLVHDALMQHVRALLIHNNLKEAGEIIGVFPSIEEIEKNVEFNGELTYILLTMQTKQEILGIMKFS
jgi:two-component system, chemotaxis family, sensor kinase CheA